MKNKRTFSDRTFISSGNAPIVHPCDIRGHMITILLLTFNILILNTLSGYSQDISDTIILPREKKIVAFYQQGKVFPTNSFLSGTNIQQKPINAFRAISLQFTWQTNGRKLWEQIYDYPRFGAGVYKAFFINTSEPGNPLALYGTFCAPIHRWNRFSLNTEIGAGLAFNWNTYRENRYNLAMGGKVTVFVDTGVYFEYDAQNGIFLSGGAGFNHYSNGALKKPNLGINTFSPKISVGYNLNRSQGKYREKIIPEFVKKNEVLLTAYTGWENMLYDLSVPDSIPIDGGIFYNTYGIGATFKRQVSYKSKFGIGLMIDYYGTACRTFANPDSKRKNASFSNGLEISVYPSYEIVINKLSIIMQPGFFLYRKNYPYRTPFMYQRIGLNAALSENLSFGINMRAHRFSIADYIEWTIGYRLPLRNGIIK
jgi:hypothetical protein